MKKGSTIGENTRFKKGERRGFRNVNWKGKDVGYSALHQWVTANYGKPTFCEECKTSTRQMYHWANLSGSYLRDRDDWKRLCVSCHKFYDLGRK